MIPSRLEDLLAERLAPVIQRSRRARVLTSWAAIAGGAALVALILRLGEEQRGWDVGHGWTLLLLATAGAAAWTWHRARQAAGDPRQAARLIEARQPELRALLLTAVAQTPAAPGEPLGYMQEQLLRQAIDRSDPVRWGQAVSTGRLGALAAGSVLGGLLVGYCVLTGLMPDLPSLFDDDYGLRITPGHTQAERGSNVLVLARFDKRLPAGATLVVRQPGKPPARVEMRRSLADPVWGGLTPALAGERVEYFVEHDGGRSPRFRIQVFQRPEVERIDARIEYPRQPALPARDVVDARYLSVAEGARLTVTVRLAAAAREVRLQVPKGESLRLAARDGKQDREFWGVLTPKGSRRYDVLVSDEGGRKNPTPPRLTIDVHRNQPPEIALSFPGRDVRVSPLEELTVEARIRDDTAVLAHGLSYRLAGRPARELRLGGETAGKPQPAVAARATIALEDLGAKPDELLTYHFWAEDRDGAGKLRRTSGDLFFAEVRPFEERFRERSSDGGDQMEGGEGGQMADKVRRQKEIMNATWRLEREARDGKPSAELAKDVEVVARSQQQLKQATEELQRELPNARARSALEATTRDMTTAHKALTAAAKAAGARQPVVAPLETALEAQQKAYAGLLRLRDRNHDVTRGRGGGGGGGEGEQPELAGLELKQKESRYETRREAAGAQRGARPDREALSRLEELARRQQGLSERLKEAQAALEQGREPDEAEQERRLKRLREEQQELLEEMDQLAQRLERQTAASASRRTGEDGREGAGETERERVREALERTRAELERSRREAAAAAEALARGQTGQALGASTRAERELQRARGDLAKNVGAGLEQEMRELRDAARRLDEQQQQIARALGGPATPGPPSMQPTEATGAGTNPTTARKLAGDLRRQRDEAGKLLAELEALSGEAEPTAPLLSRKLYEGLREARMNDVEPALGAAGELLERNLADEARSNEARARKGIEALRGQVDEAAKGVLGDETQALRAAQAEIDSLLAEAAREGQQQGQPGQQQGQPGQQQGQPGQQQGQQSGQPGGQRGQASQPNPEGAPGSGPAGNAGPITGDGFRGFAERLRDLEDLLDDTQLRNRAAGVRDSARAIRADWKYQSKRPSQAVLREQILGPLTELRDRLSDRLNRLERNDRLVPLDRDPIPGRYTDLVRRYWKSLSEGR